MNAEELHASRVLWAVVNALVAGQSIVLGRVNASQVEIAIIGATPGANQQKPVRLRLKASTWEELTRRAALQMSLEFVQAEAGKK